MTTDEIAAQLALFIDSTTQVTELRALNVGQRGRTYAGWFDGAHLEEMARWALNLTREASGVYFIPNPVKPELQARSANTVNEIRRGGIPLTRDSDIVECRWLIVDLDPVRQAESQECPSTDEELGKAIALAEQLKPVIAGWGFTRPIAMCSGNGVHLAYRLQIAGSPDAKPNPLSALLTALGTKFSTEYVRLDANTGNPSRMLKVPQTVSRKGTSSPGRQFRTVEIFQDTHHVTATV